MGRVSAAAARGAEAGPGDGYLGARSRRRGSLRRQWPLAGDWRACAVAGPRLVGTRRAVHRVATPCGRLPVSPPKVSDAAAPASGAEVVFPDPRISGSVLCE